MDDVRTVFARNGLYRTTDDRLVAGICSGIGRRLGLTPWTSRLLFVLLLCLVPGSQLLVYPVLWVLMPVAPSTWQGQAPAPAPGG